jgi:putative endonuclease
MTGQRQALGRWGEDTAVEYLRTSGHVILERNLRTRDGELDIVAQKGGLLVFVEVKTRSENALLQPEEAVTPRKQRRMLAVAERYLQEHPGSGDAWQFDVIAIVRHPGSKATLEHFENVFG